MISLFDLLKIGIGPSSSHTVGPMLATRRFVRELDTACAAAEVAGIVVELYGSLALTGIGHHTDRAVVLGLCGEDPRTVDPESIDARFTRIATEKRLEWLGKHAIAFDLSCDLILHRSQVLPQHPNGIRCTARRAGGTALLTREYFSVGGGFVVDSHGASDAADQQNCPPEVAFPFRSAEELIGICRTQNLSISDIVHRNELSFRSEEEIAQRLDEIWSVMRGCIETGCRTTGILPGGLGIRRRAPEIYQRLCAKPSGTQPAPPSRLGDATPSASAPNASALGDPLDCMDWVTLFALAVNEQNAAGGRVVTAPTNGAAGVIPAVAAYYERFLPDSSREGLHTFLKTAAAVGMLYKRNASLSAAEMGCQGEVGVACSMAAAGLAAVLGGTPGQIENAAEIGMEHNLGLTCDPIGGLVQIPCIERNAMGAIKAINAARLAVLYGDGSHRVSLDGVIETMRQTGVDMQSKYKETSLGGLAVNVINC